jgi:hypothetical protein
LNAWQIGRKIGALSERIGGPVETETWIDSRCLTEPESKLLDRVQEIIEEYSPRGPPQDVIEKNADLWSKGLEIFARRAVELFVCVMPASLCCDELEEWYFKIYFHNFMMDWIESVGKLRSITKEKYDELFAERKEMGMLDRVFRFPKSWRDESGTQNVGGDNE